MGMIDIGSAMSVRTTFFIGLFLGTIPVVLGAGADMPVSPAAVAEAFTDEYGSIARLAEDGRVGGWPKEL